VATGTTAGGWLTRRRWGYVVWGVALGFVFVPEILAAISLSESQLPFPTISRMTGHLEYVNSAWEIAPTVGIVFVLVSLLRVPLSRSGDQTQARLDQRRATGDRTPHRTPGGRITFQAVAETSADYDSKLVLRPGQNDRLAVLLFAARTLAAAGVIVAATLLAAKHWPNVYVTGADGVRHKLPNYRVAYVLYGSIGFFWLLLPALTVHLNRKDPNFPGLFRTIQNFENWVAKPRGPQLVQDFLAALAWLISFALIWGMVFLMMHLTLYPFPDITRILNHAG
jgi:hypothetical protein